MTDLKTAVLELRSTELTRRDGLLLEHLLLMRVGVAYQDDMFLFPVTTNRAVVELLNDLFTRVTGLESGIKLDRCSSKQQQHNNLPSKANTTSITCIIAKDFCRADLEGLEAS